MTGTTGEQGMAVEGLARFLYEHECCGGSDGPWTDRRRDFYLRLASDVVSHLGQRCPESHEAWACATTKPCPSCGAGVELNVHLPDLPCCFATAATGRDQS